MGENEVINLEKLLELVSGDLDEILTPVGVCVDRGGRDREAP